MSLKKTKILGININTDKKEKILEYLRKYLENGSQIAVHGEQKTLKPLTIVTPNPEQIVLATRDEHFAKMLNEADIAIPDGVGLVWADRLVHGSQLTVHNENIAQTIPGVELMEEIVKIAAKEGFRIGLIGGTGGVAVKALECLQKKHPSLIGWAEDGPELEVGKDEIRIRNYGKEKNQISQIPNSISQILDTDSREDYLSKIVQKINKTETKVLFLGFGAPKQEYMMEELVRTWIFVHSKKGKFAMNNERSAILPLILMSVGGSFDIIAGKVPRAPLLLRRIGIEWFWRLIIEPWRWKRQMALFRFMRLVIAERKT